MKLTATIIAIGIFSYFSQSFGPWWTGVLVAFLMTAVVQIKPGTAFLAGFIGLGLAWGVAAGIADVENSGILSARIGEMFGGLPGWSLVPITAIIGALLGGLAGLSGASGMKLIIDK
jgi:hypothetical protein